MKTAINFLLLGAAFTGCAMHSALQPGDLEVFNKPSSHTAGLIIRAHKPLEITSAQSDCELRLAAGPHVLADGHSLQLRGVRYLPRMQPCRKSAGELQIPLLANESTFDLLSADGICQPSWVRLKTTAGAFVQRNLPTASLEQIEQFADESRQLRPWVDESERVELSAEELERQARDCRLY